MFERPASGERILLVHVHFGFKSDEAILQEFETLASATGCEVMGLIEATRKAPDKKYFVGQGKAQEIKDFVEASKSEVIVFNHELSPAQARNLEAFLKCRVMDRVGLILDIFAARAQTFEGKLQVELAQLNYLSTRLIRGWTHLERQKGGIGLRGPGEKQLELDRRMIRNRIHLIQKRLSKVKSQRQLGRRTRQRSQTPTISLVGYTNAGKSTLFNHLTSAQVYAADQLFATLDPTMKQLMLPKFGKVILIDTVGFIQDLPHSLVAAFSATLEETIEADLLIHVIDASDPLYRDRIEQVESVLESLGAKDNTILQVMNKIDRLENFEAKSSIWAQDETPCVWLSAQTGEGLDLLKSKIVEILSDVIVRGDLTLAPGCGKMRATLYKNECVEKETVNEMGELILTISLPKVDLERLCQQHGLAINDIFTETAE